MAKRFTPVIGLAVVVALAMAAVFGAMSLTNPAFAAVGVPVDAELAERTFSPQDVPDDFEATGGDGSVTLAWDDDSDADSWIVSVRRNAENESWVTFEPAANNTDVVASAYTFTLDNNDPGVAEGGVVAGLINGDEYCFRVQVREGTATSGIAGPACATPLATPKQADDLEVDPGNGQVTLEWDEPGDDNIDKWQVVYGELATESAVPDATTAAALNALDDWKDIPDSDSDTDEYTVTGLKTLTVYWFAVRALNGNTPSDPAERENTEDLYVVTTTTGTPAAPGSIVLGPETEGLPKFVPDSMDPGKSTRYTVEFDIRKPVNTLINDLVIEFHEDYSVPSAIGTSAVTITTGPYLVPEAGGQPIDPGTENICTDDDAENDTQFCVNFTFNPRDVAVDGEEVFISIGDITEDDDIGVYSVGGHGITMEVVFRQSAGISNPTEAGEYSLVAITFEKGTEIDNGDEDIDSLAYKVPQKISLSEGDGGLGTEITATGKGYKNSTTLTVFLDKKVLVMWDHDDNDRTDMRPLGPGNNAKVVGKGMVDDYNDAIDDDSARGNVPKVPTNDDGTARHVDPDGYAWAPNRNLDLTDDRLCAVDKIGGDDVGKCDFTISHPTFEGGFNYINAVDGRNNYAPNYDEFELTSSIQASPAGGSPGEIILIQVVDFTPNSSLDKVTLGRQDYCGGDNNPIDTSFTCPALVVDSTGSGNFKITVPNWARSGVQELKVFGTGDDDGSQNVTIGGPQITITPASVLANQRISLVGTGFSSNAVIGDDDLLEGTDMENDLSKITIGGEVVRRGRISDGEDVEVDSGGNWSASVDLPLSSSTTADGERVIRVTDSGGRSGVVTVAIPAREVTITPDTGRVGTIAVVRGNGFPSKNDEGSSFNVEIVYDAGNDKETTVSAVPDAGGSFEVQLRIPTTAAIPSSNTVKVTFEDDNGVAVVTTVAHDVPEGIITLSNTSGGPRFHGDH